jgi:hypothetical protein
MTAHGAAQALVTGSQTTPPVASTGASRYASGEHADRSSGKQRESAGLRNQSLIAAMFMMVVALLAAPTHSAGQAPTISSLSPSSANAGCVCN